MYEKLLIFFVVAPLVFSSCGGDDDDDDATFAEENYSTAQVKALGKAFGDEFESASVTYLVGDSGKVSTNKDSGDLPWGEFQLVLETVEKVGDDSFVSYTATLPSEIQSVEGYKSVFPSKGFFKIGEVTDLTVALERYTDTSTADDKFSAGTATFGDDGIVLKFTIAGAADVTSRVDGTVNSEWTFDLSKKVDE